MIGLSGDPSYPKGFIPSFISSLDNLKFRAILNDPSAQIKTQFSTIDADALPGFSYGNQRLDSDMYKLSLTLFCYIALLATLM